MWSTNQATRYQSRSLTDCIDGALLAIWPRRAQQELLLDLGEHKLWDQATRRAAVEDAANWFVRELGLPATLYFEAHASRVEVEDEYASTVARRLDDFACLGEPVVGVAKWASTIAPALGSSAKTLANSLSGPMRTDRADHRWLRVIARAERGHAHNGAWCFHRRSLETTVDALSSLANTAILDAGDALVVFSLLALWQRRRSTRTVRGNRGRPKTRRKTPKPIARLLGELAKPSQPLALVRLARHLKPDAGRAVAELAIEAALTEAHLAPHLTRSTVPGCGGAISGESWLRAAEAALTEAAGLVSVEDRAIFAFRVDRQRAWHAQRPQSVADAQLRSHPYVRACLVLEQVVFNLETETTAFAPATPGLLMLLPALRSRGLVEEL